MNSTVWQVFSIVLVLGALITIIPLARQVFRRHDDSDGRHD
ncbi:hypothetical protein [Nocardia arthritidis]|nr:hypothetical protein [Nocardia arthritidis]